MTDNRKYGQIKVTFGDVRRKIIEALAVEGRYSISKMIVILVDEALAARGIDISKPQSKPAREYTDFYELIRENEPQLKNTKIDTQAILQGKRVTLGDLSRLGHLLKLDEEELLELRNRTEWKTETEHTDHTDKDECTNGHAH